MISKEIIFMAILAVTLISIASVKCFWFSTDTTKESVEIKEYPFTTGTLTVKNDAGGIKIESWNKDIIEITTTKKAPEKIINDIIISIDIKDNKASVEIHFPNTHCDNKSVNLSIKIPKHMDNIKADMSAGTITIKDVDGNMNLENSAGNIDVINSTANVHAKVVVGSMHIIQKTLPANANINLKSTAGSISLSLPSDASAHVVASTTVGSISSKFNELKEIRKFPYISSKLDGLLATGSAKINLEATTGSISIKKN